MTIPPLPSLFPWKVRFKASFPIDEAALLLYIQTVISEGRGGMEEQEDTSLLFYLPIEEVDRLIFPLLKEVKEVWIQTHPLLSIKEAAAGATPIQ